MVDLNEPMVIAAYLRREAETTTDFRQRERCTDAYKAIDSLVAEVDRLRGQVEVASELLTAMGLLWGDKMPNGKMSDGISFGDAIRRYHDARAAWEKVKT